MPEMTRREFIARVGGAAAAGALFPQIVAAGGTVDSEGEEAAELPERRFARRRELRDEMMTRIPRLEERLALVCQELIPTLVGDGIRWAGPLWKAADEPGSAPGGVFELYFTRPCRCGLHRWNTIVVSPGEIESNAVAELCDYIIAPRVKCAVAELNEASETCRGEGEQEETGDA